MHSRKITRIAALFLIFAYLPILAGGGEWVLCVHRKAVRARL